MKKLKLAQRTDKNGKTHKIELYCDGAYWRCMYTWFVGTKEEEYGHTFPAFDNKVAALLRINDVLAATDFEKEHCLLFKKEYKGAIIAGVAALNSFDSEQSNIHAHYLSEFLDIFF